MRTIILGLILFTFIPFQFSNAQVKVHGYVVEVTTGKPILDAVVFVNDEYNITKDPSLRDTTDINGFYEISVDTGKYHFGVYAPYQFENEEYMLVYQPGIFDVSESSLPFFKEYGFKVSYGLSKTYFEILHILKEDSESLYTKNNIVRKQLGDLLYLTKPRINTNSRPSYRNKPIIYTEKKSW
jgi:hypothetical protein